MHRARQPQRKTLSESQKVACNAIMVAASMGENMTLKKQIAALFQRQSKHDDNQAPAAQRHVAPASGLAPVHQTLDEEAGSFPADGEIISTIGRATLDFSTSDEIGKFKEMRAADVTLSQVFGEHFLQMRYVLGVSSPDAIPPAAIAALEQQFIDERTFDSRQPHIFCGSESRQLIEAAYWFLSQEHRNFPINGSGKLILSLHSRELIVPNDYFRARTRMAIAFLDPDENNVKLELFVGYLASEWYGVEYGLPRSKQDSGFPSHPDVQPLWRVPQEELIVARRRRGGKETITGPDPTR